MKTIFVGLLAVLLLSGCAAGPEDLANQGDWHEIGYRDGIKGQPPRGYSKLQELGEANLSQYDDGYLEGVKVYCNPDFAYQIGLSGQHYEGVCEGTEHAQKFRMEWQRGWNESK
ncbi:DUF2799 domain-containing protein [Vibrio sp. JC009]|uniref:DUF2799 domain-containing protein n=1 Tax=Vibrio sp. JC009 TaxID=2912314 RepID=UPI0023AEAC2A|nr:DUF2799 domain-containing protein [Vibrio sp. JC009]WED22408.1 DUF2799 domain-containing protein [Vibrio sp. JC009]